MNFLPPYSIQVWRAIIYSIIGLTLLGFILFGVHSCNQWRVNRDLGKAREEVNAAMQDVNAAKQTVDGDRVEEAVAIEKVKQATNQALQASDATEAAKQAVNEALVKYQAAVNANRPTGTTQADLEAKLRELGQ